MSDMLAHALEWAARGFRVFPCIPLSKHPRDEEFFVKASSDPAVIAQLWHNPITRQPGDYNVGVSTDDLVVVDVDVKDGKNGTQGFEELGGDHDTLIVRTPTGGLHYYYTQAGVPVGNRANIVNGVDIRGHHGYVLAPGSRVVDAAKGIDGTYTVVRDAAMAWVPEGISPYCLAPRTTRASDVSHVELDSDIAITQAIDFLQHTALPSIEGMGGNDNAYKVATRVVTDFGISTDIAAALMLEHWNVRCEPPWDVSDIQRFCVNAATYSTGVAGSFRADAMFGQIQIVAPAAAQAPVERGLYLGNALDPLTLGKRPWVYHDLALRGQTTTVVAEGAGGKSTWSLILALHAAVGRSFGPFKLEREGVPHRVLVHDDENDKAEQARIMFAACREYGIDYKLATANMLIWAQDDEALLLATSEGQKCIPNMPCIEGLISVLRDGAFDMFALNPLVNLHQCNENDNAQMKQVMNWITYIAQQTQTAGVVFHHSGKGTSGAGRTYAGNAEVSRGAGAIVNASRVALTLSSPSAADKEAMGIRDEAQFTRIDKAKVNVSKRGDPTKALMWMRWKSHLLPNDEWIGVPLPVDIEHETRNDDQLIVQMIDDYLTERGEGRVSFKLAIEHIRMTDPILNKSSPQSLRSRIGRITAAKEMFQLNDGRRVKLHHENEGASAFLSIA